MTPVSSRRYGRGVSGRRSLEAVLPVMLLIRQIQETIDAERPQASN